MCSFYTHNIVSPFNDNECWEGDESAASGALKGAKCRCLVTLIVKAHYLPKHRITWQEFKHVPDKNLSGGCSMMFVCRVLEIMEELLCFQWFDPLCGSMIEAKVTSLIQSTHDTYSTFFLHLTASKADAWLLVINKHGERRCVTKLPRSGSADECWSALQTSMQLAVIPISPLISRAQVKP